MPFGMKGDRPSNTDDIVEHLKHVNYPVTGKAFREACSNMSDVPSKERDWVLKNLPEDKTFNSADEIRRELGL